MVHNSENKVKKFITKLIPEFGDKFDFDNRIITYNNYITNYVLYKNFSGRLLIPQYFHNTKKIDLVLIDNIIKKRFLIEIKSQKVSGTAHEKISADADNLILNKKINDIPIIIVLGNFFTPEVIDERKTLLNDRVNLFTYDTFMSFIENEYGNIIN